MPTLTETSLTQDDWVGRPRPETRRTLSSHDSLSPSDRSVSQDGFVKRTGSEPAASAARAVPSSETAATAAAANERARVVGWFGMVR